jgi:putative tryptophan/tyrosine transport system substrate-binding protein
MSSRREFITLLGGAAIVPLRAAAQQAQPMRRVGVLMHVAEADAEAQLRLAAFVEGLQEAGWSVGRNVQIDARWSPGDIPRLFRDAAALVATHPDVILAGIGATTQALQQATKTMPIVFAQGVDPVGNSYVDSLARPGGNTTGFVQLDYDLAGKWLELLKELAPGVKRVAMLREAGPAGIGQWAILQSTARTLGVEVKPIDLLRDAALIERDITTFAATPNSGLVIAVSASGLTHRDLIVALTARHRLPAVYAYRTFVVSGGLATYGADIASQYRRAAGYVDRILKGEKPAELPVQTATKYNLVINMKTAKALGLTVPQTLLARADEVIE